MPHFLEPTESSSSEPREPSSHDTERGLRSLEIDRIESALLTSGRVISLVGLPGVGKSWLARELAKRHHGVICHLADARSEDDFLLALAGALGVEAALPTDRRRLEAQLVARGRDFALVVLDDAELVLASVAGFATRFVDGAGSRLLVTSREPIRIAGERRFEIAPLELDDAVAMFVGRARAIFGDAAIGREEIALLGPIVAAIDCLPLAIELAVSRLDQIDVRTLHGSLERATAGLESGFRDTSERHSSLGAAFAGVWSSLDPAARRMLAAAALFRGGFARDDLFAVACPTEPHDAQLAAFAVLRRRSLVREAEGERFRLLHVVRDLVEQAGGHSLPFANAHAEHFAARSVREEPAWVKDAPAVLGRDRENLLAAFRHAREHRPALAGAIARGLHPVLVAGGPRSLHFEVLQAAAAYAVESGDALALAHAHMRIAEARLHWDVDLGAIDLLEEACETFRAAGDESSVARATLMRAYATLYSKRYDEASRLTDEALVSARASGERGLVALGLRARARRWWYEDPKRAEELLHEAAAVASVDRALSQRADVFSDLSHVHLNAGDYRAAADFGSRALAIHERLGAGVRIAFSQGDLAMAYWMAGDREAARAARETAIEQARARGASRAEGLFLGYGGMCEATSGEIELAFHALALAIERMNESKDAIYQSVFEAWYAALLAHDGQRERARALAEAVAARPLPLHQEHPTERLLAFAREMPPGLIPPKRIVEERLVEGFLERARGPGHEPPPAVPGSMAGPVRVEENGFYCELPDGVRIDLQRRPVLRRALAVIAARARLGEHARLEDVIGGAWPGEKILPEAAAHRAYMAISSLRRLGLRDRLQSRGDGYELVGPIEITRRSER